MQRKGEKRHILVALFRSESFTAADTDRQIEEQIIAAPIVHLIGHLAICLSTEDSQNLHEHLVQLGSSIPDSHTKDILQQPMKGTKQFVENIMDALIKDGAYR